MYVYGTRTVFDQHPEVVLMVHIPGVRELFSIFHGIGQWSPECTAAHDEILIN